MKKQMIWINVAIIMATAVYLIDLNIYLYRHPANTIPVLKYTIIGLFVILFLIITLAVFTKSK